MHRIVESHLRNFSEGFGCLNETESTQFEMFCNYSILSSKYTAKVEIEDVTTGDGDDGIDGVAIIIDEEVVPSAEDAKIIFKADKRNHEVELVFIQAKTSEAFELGEIYKFTQSVKRFLTGSAYAPNDEVQKNAWDIYEVILKNVPKIREGKPSLHVSFVTTGTYKRSEPHECAKVEFIKDVEELGYFNKTEYQYLGRDQIISLWVSTYSGVSASLETFSHAPLPKIAGIEEAYLAVVKAKDLVSNLLLTEDGSLRGHVFEENVRSFLGIDNRVNESIAKTVNDSQTRTRFPVLNNGITVVSPDVRMQGNILHLVNYQIVNGCQTSNVLFNNRHSLTDDVMVNLKIVETTSEDVFSDLVRATNSQSIVEERQFLSLRPIIKKVERYFNSFNDGDGRLYFERRDRQYVGNNIPALRTFNVHTTTRCVAAMFCTRPDLALKYHKTMYEELTSVIFNEDNREIVFYTAGLTLYRLNLLISNSVIPQNMKRYKWHLLPLVRNIISGEKIPPLRDKKIESYCQKIIDEVVHPGERSTNTFKAAVKIIQSMGDISVDRLKRQAVIHEMLAKVK